jgi:hypothetical protein
MLSALELLTSYLALAPRVLVFVSSSSCLCLLAVPFVLGRFGLLCALRRPRTEPLPTANTQDTGPACRAWSLVFHLGLGLAAPPGLPCLVHTRPVIYPPSPATPASQPPAIGPVDR